MFKNPEIQKAVELEYWKLNKNATNPSCYELIKFYCGFLLRASTRPLTVEVLFETIANHFRVDNVVFDDKEQVQRHLKTIRARRLKDEKIIAPHASKY